jgi:dihydrofolate reductase
MRDVILFVNLTLDGMLAGPNGELDFMKPDPAMNTELTTELRGRVDTILEGRVIHHAFEANFRAEAADPASPPELVDFAHWMLDTPKVVFSRSTTPDLAAAVAELKAKPGRDMVLFGGVATARSFVELDLVDEYWIKLYPTAIGAGQPLFGGRRVELDLLQARAHDSGITTLRYRNTR